MNCTNGDSGTEGYLKPGVPHRAEGPVPPDVTEGYYYHYCNCCILIHNILLSLMQSAQADEMVSCNTLHVVRSGGDAFRQEGLN